MLTIIVSYKEIWTRIAHAYALLWSRSRGSHQEPWTYADTVDAFLLRRIADDERKARADYPQTVAKAERDRILPVCEMRRELVRLYRQTVDHSSDIHPFSARPAELLIPTTARHAGDGSGAGNVGSPG